MTNKMTEEKVNHSTYRLCTDLLNILDSSSQQQEIYGRFLYMPDSSLSNKGVKLQDNARYFVLNGVCTGNVCIKLR